MVDDHLVVAGGNTWSDDRQTKQWLADSLILREGAWMAGPPLPSPRAYTAFAQSRGVLYLAGGMNTDGRLREVVRLADASSGARWEELPPLPTAMSMGAAAVLGGRLYVLCGESDAAMLNAMWSLSLDAPDAWREEPALPGSPRAFPAVVSTGKAIIVLGGVSSWSPLAPLADAWRFDTEGGAWKRLPDLSSSGYAWSAAMMEENYLVLAGQADGEIHDDIWRVDLSDMRTGKLGDAVIQTTTAPLVRVADDEWWLIAGEPDSKRTRTNRVTRITVQDRPAAGAK